MDVWEAALVIVELELGVPLFHGNTHNDIERLWVMRATLGPFDRNFMNLLKSFNPQKSIFTPTGDVIMTMHSKTNVRPPKRKARNKHQLDRLNIAHTPERFLNISTLEVRTM